VSGIFYIENKEVILRQYRKKTIYRILCGIALSFLFDSVGNPGFQTKTASERLCLFTVSGCEFRYGFFFLPPDKL